MALIRPKSEPGKAGKQVMIQVNAFECQILPTGTVQHYDVKFPNGVAKPTRITAMKYLHAKGLLLQGKNEPFTFDGKANMYVLSSTTMGEQDHRIDENVVLGIAKAPERMMNVKITHVNQVPMASLLELVKGRWNNLDKDSEPMQAIQALNIAMKRPPLFDNGFPFKTSTFYVPREDTAEGQLLKSIFEGQQVKHQLQGACEVWGGYFMSIRPGVNKMHLNVDRVSGVFVKPGNLVDILMEYMGAKDINRVNTRNPDMPLHVKIKIRRFLKGLYIRVKTRDPKLKFKIKELHPQNSAVTFKFKKDDGRETNVKDYYRQTHNLNLRYPDLPLINISKTSWIPMETADVVAGMNFFGRLSTGQISEMLKSRFVTLHPKLKKQAIEIGLRQISINSAYHQGWDIKINPNFMEVGARQLPPPQLIYKRSGKDQTVPTIDGTWKTSGLQAFRPGGNINRWVVVVYDADQQPKPPKWEGCPLDQVVDALKGLIRACKELGIVFAVEKPGAILHAGNTQNVRESIIAVAKKAGYGPSSPPDLVVTFSHGSNQYDQIKRVCDVQLGVPSQNLVIGKAGGDRGGYWQNVALKINVKLKNGINQAINGGLPGFKQFPTILFGADVTHPKPSSFAPSISCVVASFDPQGTQYACISNIQDSTKEIVRPPVC